MPDPVTILFEEPALLAGLTCILLFVIHDIFLHQRMTNWLSRQDTPNKRLPFYNRVMRDLWLLAIIAMVSWKLSGRNFQDLGFAYNPGPGFWVVTCLAAIMMVYLIWQVWALQTSPKVRQGFRDQIAKAGDISLMHPETPAEFRRFVFVSITAGITEEIIFRGFLIGVLVMAFPLWVAGLTASIIFALAHAYQGVTGIFRIFLIGLALTLAFIVSKSLWPVIALHIVIDVSSGIMLRISDTYKHSDLSQA